MEEEKEKVAGEEDVSELDALQQENDLLRSELKNKDAVIAGLEQKLAEKDGEIAALKQSLDTANQDLTTKNEKLEAAVAAYTEMVKQANPSPVAEMIKGNSIEEVNESLKSAQALVEKVKKELGEESVRVRVPAGAPQRTPLDLSVLSSKEKIRYGMEGR
jgi:peptidoglycan hydrolase CwlO-like protein